MQILFIYGTLKINSLYTYIYVSKYVKIIVPEKLYHILNEYFIINLNYTERGVDIYSRIELHTLTTV